MALDPIWSVKTAGGSPTMNDTEWLPAWTGPFPHVDGSTYPAKAVAQDDGWTMVSNKPTAQKPAPVRTGDSQWVSGLGETPPWTKVSPSVVSVITGQRYRPSEVLIIDQWRAWIPDITGDIKYEVWSVSNPESVPVFTKIMDVPLPSSEGWVSAAVEPIYVSPGQDFDLLLVALSQVTPTQWAGNWDQINSNASPATGQAVWRQNGAQIDFSETDHDGTDRAAQLAAVPVGAALAVDGVEYLVTSSASGGVGVWQIGVSPPDRPVGGVKSFAFEYGASVPVSYVTIADHFASDSAVTGLFSTSGYDNIVEDENAYGIDIEIEGLSFPTDWSVLITPTGGSGGGGSTSTPPPESGGGAWELVSETDLSTVPAGLVYTDLDDTPAVYQWRVENAKGTLDAYLQVQVSTDNGATWKFGASDYRWAHNGRIDAGIGDAQDNADSALRVSATMVGNAAGEDGYTGIIEAAGIGNGKKVPWLFDGGWFDNFGRYTRSAGGGAYDTSESFNAMRLIVSAGDFASGIVRLYTLAK